MRRFLLALLVLASVTGAGAQIQRVTRATTAPVQWQRTDFVVTLRAPWTDPFDSAQVALDLAVTAPSGRPLRLPAFYTAGASDGVSVWHARFCALEAGDYRGEFVLTVRGQPAGRAPVAFTVAPGPGRGFLHAGDAWTLRFDDGTPFRGLGENLGWESRATDDSKYFRALHEQPRFNYDYLLGRLGEHGGNFARTWMCAWNLPLEWPRVVDTNRYANHPESRYNPDAAGRLDQLIDRAERSGVFLMLALDSHVALMGGNWALNPYNRANGGPAATPAEFFTDPVARARYRDRLRYLVARWGYSPHLGVWEFFNEVDNAMYGTNPRIPDATVTAWHAEMSAYLRALDPYGRPITTSISHRDVAGLNTIPTLDFNQRHIYRNTAGIPAAIREALAANPKPYVIGEYGYEWDWSKDFNTFADRMDGDFRLGLWLGLFSPTPILPMSWWWEFFDERDVTPAFAAVREIHEAMLAAGGGHYAECAATATGASALAVRCGATAFVCVYRDPGTAGPVTVTLAAPAPVEIRSYDPDTRRWQPLSAAHRTGDAVQLELPALPANGIAILSVR